MELWAKALKTRLIDYGSYVRSNVGWVHNCIDLYLRILKSSIVTYLERLGFWWTGIEQSAAV